MKPLVSILIAAYNAEDTLGHTLQSAVGQTWANTEIIVIDDGSTDSTAEVARRFRGVTVVSTENQGLSKAQNHAFELSHGDYLQYLDADDILSLDKIEKQLEALGKINNPQILASSPWAPFYYRIRNARFVDNALCRDLSPVEWLLRKMGQNLHMQNATWLVRRELAVAAGPWDETLRYDQDGEYFSRVLLASKGTHFIPGTGIYYRKTGSSSISFIGNSNKKKESLVASMKLHVKYLLSLEDSERTRAAAVQYLQNWYHNLYLSRPDLSAELEALVASLGGRLTPPRLSWKYAWLHKALGWETAIAIQQTYNRCKNNLLRKCDKMVYRLEGGSRLENCLSGSFRQGS